ncbi:MAG: radical SAM protein [Spirochaetota bacterium]
MKIALICPSTVQPREGKAACPPLAFSVLTGLTPKKHAVVVFDERAEPLPEDLEADLVGITVDLLSARAAYKRAEQFRLRGIRVIFGGYHPTLVPEEGLEYADSILIGNAEGIWENVLEDLEGKKLKRIYGSKESPRRDLYGVVYNHDIFRKESYALPLTVETLRGCRYRCEFCSIHNFNNRRYLKRKNEEVIEEIKKENYPYVYFVDDNFIADREHALELLKMLEQLHIRWSSQISIDVAKDEEALRLMQKSGCDYAAIGFESLNERNLRLMGKAPNIAIQDYDKAIKTIHDYNIKIHGFFIVGYDYDTVDVFDHILDFTKRNRLFLTNVHPLVPVPGTRLYERYKDEGLIIEDKFWLREDFRYGPIYHRPKGMSKVELEEGLKRLNAALDRLNLTR